MKKCSLLLAALMLSWPLSAQEGKAGLRLTAPRLYQALPQGVVFGGGELPGQVDLTGGLIPLDQGGITSIWPPRAGTAP